MKQQSETLIQEENIEQEAVDDNVRRKVLGFDEKIMLVKVDFQTGGIGYMHKHPHSQVTYIESGKFNVQIGNEKKVLQSGDCYYVPPDIEHGVVNLEGGVLIDVFSPMRDDFIK